jgi:hypothetical protein
VTIGGHYDGELEPGMSFTQEAVCHEDDTFEKRKGVELAFRRAAKLVSIHERVESRFPDESELESKLRFEREQEAEEDDGRV